MLRKFNACLKRSFDLIVSVLGLIALAPVLLAVAAAIRWKMGSPVVFRQKRPGLRGKPFMIYKFRTMLDAVDSAGNPLPDEKRLTWLGIFLRATSLDELPELFNVVRGEMSLVGPRPLRMEYLSRYSPEQMRRHDALPGITGWAQINGRNAIDWESKFELDVWYVDHQNLWLDLKILFLTAWQVIRRKDISAENHATMPEFLGIQKTSDVENVRKETPGT
jgi:lipopolysaccharide/colanic/teichoic acid biosynthesis glycosyltransferase